MNNKEIAEKLIEIAKLLTEDKSTNFNDAWEARNRLYDEGYKLYVEGTKLHDEGDKLYAEGFKIWEDAIYKEYGKNAKIIWNGADCIVEGVTYKK